MVFFICLNPKTKMDTETNPTPRITIDSAAKAQGWTVDEAGLGRHMAEDYGISPEGIERTTVVLSGKNHFSYKGSETPGMLDRGLRGVTRENDGANSIVRITTTLRGVQRSPDDINATLSHEMEHTAQGDRKDKNQLIGNIAIWGLATAGAIIGSRASKHPTGRVAGVLIGGIVGQLIGYQVAPHENQARQRAEQVRLTVITKSSESDTQK
jgi:hypothetical protein